MQLVESITNVQEKQKGDDMNQTEETANTKMQQTKEIANTMMHQTEEKHSKDIFRFGIFLAPTIYHSRCQHCKNPGRKGMSSVRACSGA